MKRSLAVVAVLAAVTPVAAGCGSSDSSDSSTSAGTGSAASTASQATEASALVKQAEATLAKITQDPPNITIPPLTKPVPKGVQLTFVTCPIPTCVATEVGAKEAAKHFGWTVKTVNQGLTPDTVQAAFNGIAQNPGDVVLADAVLPNSAVSKQLEKIAAQKVPYIGLAQADPVGKLMAAATAAPNQMRADGEAMANWVIRENKGEPTDVIYVYDPALIGLLGSHDQFHATMQELCPDCKVTDLKVATADSGTKIPPQVVNQVRTNPDAKYVVFNLGDYATGVPQALKAANLPATPTMITRAATTTNMNDIKDGGMAAGLTSETIESGWRAVDLAARLLAGEELYSTTPDGGRTFLTADNLPADIEQPFSVPDFRSVFEQAWDQ